MCGLAGEKSVAGVKRRTGCPLSLQVQRTLALGRGFLCSLRHLRRLRSACRTCPERRDCPLRLEFNALVDQVVMEIQLEWDLR